MSDLGKLARDIDTIATLAAAACDDRDAWRSVDLPGFDPADRELVATLDPVTVLRLLRVARSAIALRGPHVSGVGLVNAQEEFDAAAAAWCEP